MSLRTRIARWEYNHRAWRVQLHGPREEGWRRFFARPIGEIVAHEQVSYEEYVQAATPEEQSDDLRGGLLRLARRAGALTAAGAILYAMYVDDISAASAPAQPAVEHTTCAPARATFC